MGRRTTRVRVRRIRDGVVSERPDTLAVEEPLEIRVGGVTLTTTMRSPGADMDLVRGFLLSEGVIHHRDDLAEIRYCDGVDAAGTNTYNVVDVVWTPGRERPVLARTTTTTSACGVCGTASIDALVTAATHDIGTDKCTLTPATLSAMADQMRDAQTDFARTGGTHGAALFNLDGTLMAIREDVGRHNAVDKVIGWALDQDRLPLRRTVLMVSSRASFELVQKCAVAGVPIIAAVSAPSSLAVEVGDRLGVTVVGFLRGASMNVYSHHQRIALPVQSGSPGGATSPEPPKMAGSGTDSPRT